MLNEIYLDNSSTTPVHPRVAEAVQQALTRDFGNPSSLHAKGLQAERILRQSREAVAALLGVRPREVYFTSGGTESNNLAIQGAARAMRRQGRHLITSRIEHPSVLNVFRLLEGEGYRVTYLPVNGEGQVDPGAVAEAITEETTLVSIMHVNNEVGSVQPVEEIGRLLARAFPGILFHVDAVQSAGKIPFQPRPVGVHLASLSAHKMHGPKGVGALYVKEGTRLKPLVAGGGQEEGLRSGTENVPGIAGFGVAARLALESLDSTAGSLRQLKEQLIRGIKSSIPDSRLLGPGGSAGAPHIASFSFRGVKGEVLVHFLEAQWIYVSTGAACSSRRRETSHVLAAMGLAPEEAETVVRFSFSPYNHAAEVDRVLEVLPGVIKEIRSIYGGQGCTR
mgnify:CR=1 FL=1